ncbi:hypothetical protein M747DRAFT_296290 [Aspergillus niger ATCC 13496]|uniref:Uncharacterized protein n=1 Tax=Aspergillus niger ATCC 13496 TaxID=1353008 RepID=A0A370BZX4_ASPNG|nr:hypothetical protein M747DRAFT_296290 [Aspergillus niger ATCC 13496]
MSLNFVYFLSFHPLRRVDRIFARESSVAQFPHPFFPLCWPIPIPFAYGLPRSNLPGSTASYYGLVNWV